MSFDDVPQTRKHFYPEYVLFQGPGVPYRTLLKREAITTEVSTVAIQKGKAIPLPRRLNCIASSLWCVRLRSPSCEHLFLQMMGKPESYQRGWVDFLVHFAEDAARKHLWSSPLARVLGLEESDDLIAWATAFWESHYVASTSPADEIGRDTTDFRKEMMAAIDFVAWALDTYLASAAVATSDGAPSD